MKKKILTFGTFDYLHAGHEHYLREARKHGTELITVIARDETVQKVKGHKPDLDETQRKQKLEQSGLTDKVILGNPGDKYDVIRKIRPDVICLGYDQYTFTQKLQKELIDEKMNTEVIRIDAYEPEIFKSSLIKKALT